MKTIFLTLVLLVAAPAFAQDKTKLVYPVDAANSELDNSTPMKRVEPPTREENEIDPVSPIGQIQLVRDSLARLEKVQEEMRLELGRDNDTLFSRLRDALPSKDDVVNLFPLVEKNAQVAVETRTNVETLAKSSATTLAKLDELSKTIADLRATVEAAQKTARSIETIRTSRWTDYAVIAILALVALQLLGKVGSVVVNHANATRVKLAEVQEAYNLAKQELAKAKAKESKTSK